MNRRGFLKSAGALAVAGAFPLPVEAAPLTFKGVPTHFGVIVDQGPQNTVYANIERATVTREELIAAMEKVWRECTRGQLFEMDGQVWRCE